MSLFSRSNISAQLALGPIIVTFTKVDGSERVMLCTTAPHLIPEEKQPTGSLLTEVPEDGGVLRVFDLDVNDWRSFRVGSVKSVSITEDSQSRVLLG